MSTPHRALVLVDIQQEYFNGPLEIQYPPRADSLAKITEAIDVATVAGIPVVVVQHVTAEGAPIFDPTTEQFRLHPELEERRTSSWKSITKQFGTVFAGTDLLAWTQENGIDTVSFVGYMTNNCILASVAESETHGLVAEVLSDATGAINIANAAGSVSAEAIHTTLMAIFHSNFAAVATTQVWSDAVAAAAHLEKDNLVESAMLGAQLVG